MKFMKKIAGKKIHFGYSLFIILTLSVIPASMIITAFGIETNATNAFFGNDTGIRVIKPPILCVTSNIDGECLGCPLCGTGAYTGSCNGTYEITVQRLSGIFLTPNPSTICTQQQVVKTGSRLYKSTLTAFPPKANCKLKWLPQGLWTNILVAGCSLF